MKKSKLFKVIRIGIFLLVAFIIFSNLHIKYSAKGKLFDSYENLPKVKYGLLLGTSKYLVDSGLNQYYTSRINSATELYKNGIIEKIVVSGDNKEQNYDEPTRMKNSLIKLGVSEIDIIKDANGLNTLLSISNFKNNYPNENVIVISQKFQNERAIYISKKLKINAVAFNVCKLPIFSTVQK